MAGRELVSTILSVSLRQFPTAAKQSRREIGLRLRFLLKVGVKSLGCMVSA